MDMIEKKRAVFEDIAGLERAVGTEVARSDWMTVTQEMIDDFARVTRDPQWIHVDPERARRESPFGTPIAHGFLTLSLLTPLLESVIEFPTARFRLNYGFDRVRFISPVPVDSDIRATFVMDRVDRIEHGANFAWNVTVHLRDQEKPALAALWLGRVIL